jgi:hypothetical protein
MSSACDGNAPRDEMALSRASVRISVGNHAHPIRLVNEAAGTGPAGPGIHYSRHAGESSSSPARFSVNH